MARSARHQQPGNHSHKSVFSRKWIPICLVLLIAGILFSYLLIQLSPYQQSPDPFIGHTPVNLTPEERLWIVDHPIVRICPDPDYPPFEWVTEDGQYQGIAADLIREICVVTGLRLEVAVESDWGVCVNRIQNGTTDVLGAVYRSNLRDDYLIYSEPYYRSLLPIITRTSISAPITLDDLAGKRVAAVRGFTTGMLLKKDYPGVILVEVDNVREGLEAVSLGTVDAYFGDMAASTWYVDEAGISNLHVAGSYTAGNPDDFSYAFGVGKDSPELVGIINKGLHAIPPVKREEIFRRWISPTLVKAPLEPVVLLMIAGTVGILILISLALVFWNSSLHKAVAEKTSDLADELEGHRKTAEMLKLTRFTVDHSHAMILWLDGRGFITDVNETVCQDTGYQRDDLIGTSIGVIDTSLLGSDLVDLLSGVKRDGRLSREATITSGTGTLIPVEMMLWYFTYEGTELFCAEIWDISERQKNEQAIRESEEKYRGLFRNVNDAIFLFGFADDDTPGLILDANRVAELMTGYPHEQLCSMRYYFLGIEAHPDIQDLDPTGSATGRCTFEWEILTASAEIIPVEVNLHVFEQDGRRFGLSLIRDVTERKRFEAERDAAITQIQKNLAELSVLNDGIRNPLSVILGTAEAACPDDYEVIEKQILRIDGMINQLDQRWNESEKILNYLKKHHGVVIQKQYPKNP